MQLYRYFWEVLPLRKFTQSKVVVKLILNVFITVLYIFFKFFILNI